jgi:hypothetical protein
MYILLFLSLLALGVVTIRSGVLFERRGRVLTGSCIVVATFLFFALLSFWGEMAWFEAAGFTRRFWTVVGVKALLVALGALIVVGGTFALTAFAPLPRRLKILTAAGAGILGALWAVSHWTIVMKFLARVDAGVVDPIHGRDAGFYLFTLPLYDAIFWMLLGITVLSFALALLSRLASRGGCGLLSGDGSIAHRLGPLRSCRGAGIRFGVGDLSRLLPLALLDLGRRRRPGLDRRARAPAGIRWRGRRFRSDRVVALDTASQTTACLSLATGTL